MNMIYKYHEFGKYVEDIQIKIGYHFKNLELLRQAFTRKTFSERYNRQIPNNEVLEFYGDKALDFVVMKEMSEFYGSVKNGEPFLSMYDEGRLTKIKNALVCKETIAEKIKELGFHNLLIMGHSDNDYNWQPESIQEDLFEAILGAVAIDSNWEAEALTTVVEKMLHPKVYFENRIADKVNYILLIQQWYITRTGFYPQYHTGEGQTPSEKLCRLLLTIEDKLCDFEGRGKTKLEAEMAAAEQAYRYLEENNRLTSPIDIVGTPDLDRAINQLQELYQKRYIAEPQYDFLESHDDNGNSVWQCSCRVEGINYPHMWDAAHSSKKQAKKIAAFHVLSFFLNGEADTK